MTLADYKVKGVGPDMSEAAFLAVLRENQSPVSDGEARAVYSYCLARSVSPAWLLAAFAHESGMGKAGTATETHSWGNTRRPSFGVPDTGEVAGRSGTFSRYANWADGGVSTVARICDHKPYASAFTVRAITPIWAPSSDGNDTERYIAAVLADIERFARPQEQPMTAPKIALASGHHNTSGGDAFEKQQTGPLCKAVAEHCRALGMDVRVVQPDDGMGVVSGSLDLVGNTVVKWADAGWEADIFLECHTEGGGGVGVFAIYPDAPGDVDADVRDRLGPDAARRIGAATGLVLGAGGDGVMSEQQTGVGGQGFRLGIFRTTAPLAASTTRLIIEYGAHDKEPDLSIAKSPGFAEKCGQATAGAFAAFLGWQAASPAPAPAPTVADSPFIRAIRELLRQPAA